MRAEPIRSLPRTMRRTMLMFMSAATVFATGCESTTDPDDPSIVVTEFPIANSAGDEDFGWMAYDGTNYLVAIQGRNTTLNRSTVEAQLISPTGALVGSRIVLAGATGDPARVAFDGTNYLLAWVDPTSSGSGSSSIVRGQFVSKTGTLVGSEFTIGGAAAQRGGAVGLAFGAGTYYIAYVRETSTTGNAPFTTYGRLVSTTGVAGAELTLSTTTAEGFNAVAFDGSRFLTVFTDGLNVSGRFVSSTGTLSAPVTINSVPSTEGIEPAVTVGFNGTNYLVTHARHGSGHGGHADAYAQLVSPAGVNVGGLITIAADPAIEEFAVGSVGTGTDFLVSYLDGFTGQPRVRGRFVSGSGALLGSAMTLAPVQNGKAAIGGVFHFSGTKYFLLITRGVPNALDPGDFSSWTQTDVHGALLTIPTPTGP